MMMTAASNGWLIQYEGDDKPTVKTFGTYEDAKQTADKRNKYSESYKITPAPKQDLEIQKELAIAEVKKYG